VALGHNAAVMSQTIELPPFLADCSEVEVVFRFDPDSFEQGYEYPPNLEDLLRTAVSSNHELFAGRCVIIDLQNLPAISSKQLGAMLAVRKAACPTSRVPIRNLRPNVRELLLVTKLGDFFEWR
jgi:hypothetical protein